MISGRDQGAEAWSHGPYRCTWGLLRWGRYSEPRNSPAASGMYQTQLEKWANLVQFDKKRELRKTRSMKKAEISDGFCSKISEAGVEDSASEILEQKTLKDRLFS